LHFNTGDQRGSSSGTLFIDRILIYDPRIPAPGPADTISVSQEDVRVLGDELTVQIRVRNNFLTAQSGVTVLVLRDQVNGNIVVGAEFDEFVDLAPGAEIGMLTGTFDISELNRNDLIIEVFVWDGFVTMRPLGGRTPINVPPAS